MNSRTNFPDRPVKVNWEGSLFVHHSLGMVNRELLAELVKSEHLDIRLIPYESDQFIPDESSKYHPLTRLQRQPHPDADILIRHRWPPEFSRPQSGKFILMQPWEYGSLPVTWCKSIAETVDSVWVYSRYLKECYERSGVPPDKVVVVPNGIDPLFFNPEAPPAPWVREACGNRYRFLFNGGVTTRKGADILINAYLNEFRADESVCLVIKDSNMYGKELSAKVCELATRTDIAKIAYFSDNIPHEQLPGLYTACDCYVHPYRAEGYGLPIAEATACGLPVIVTGGGACLDFIEPDGGYFVKCTLETMKNRQVGDLETVDHPFWLLPDAGHLRTLLRFIFDHKENARLRGRKAGEIMRLSHCWKNAAAIAESRIRALSGCLSPSESAESTVHERNALADRAVSLLRAGTYDQAIDLFQKILLHHGEDSLAYEGLAIAEFHKNNFKEACHLFAAANRISRNSVDIIVNWYAAAKKARTVGDLVEPVRRALHDNFKNDELRTIATEIGIL